MSSSGWWFLMSMVFGAFITVIFASGWYEPADHFEVTMIVNCRGDPFDECTGIYWGPPRRQSEEAECVDGDTGRTWTPREELGRHTNCDAETSGGI